MTESPKPFASDTFFQDLASCAQSLEVGFSPEITRQNISILANLLPTSWIGMRTTSHPIGKRDLDFRMVRRDQADIPGLLRTAGALPAAGDPVEQLVDDVARKFSPRWGVDVSVRNGIEKLWACFPAAVPLHDVMSLPSVPDSAERHGPHLSAHGIEHIALIAINFPKRSVNLYSSIFNPGHLTRDQVAALIGDLGFAVPDEDHLRRNTEAFNCYHTFAWESPDTQRVCFPIRYSADEFPSHLDPTLRTFAAEAPFLSAGKNFIFYTTYDREGGYYKVQSDYTGTHRETFRDTIASTAED